MELYLIMEQAEEGELFDRIVSQGTSPARTPSR